jgi:hypothetical protein
MTTPVAPTRQPFTPTGPVTGGVGESPRRPDGALKVKGEFAYSSDLWVEGMWGVTVRSPHPRARIRGIEVARALALPGVAAVLTAEDVPGRKTYGLEIPDQPVLAWDDVRHQGEAVAIVAADHPETARRAADLVEVDYEVLEPLVEAESAIADSAPRLHPSGNVLRLVRVRHGDPDATAEVVVTGEYELGMQDQAALGPESGLAVPDGEGGVDRYMATRWLHVDRQQVAASLGVEPELVRITLAGVGGAFGAREDLSMQIHACMLALRTGRPVKMLYSPPGVVLRPRPPPSVPVALRARRHRRRPAGVRQGQDRVRRRRLRLQLGRGLPERGHVRGWPVRGPQRDGRLLHGLHRQPALRGHARVWGGAGLLRPRVADGPAGRGARHGPGRAAAAQRDANRDSAADRAAHPGPGAGGRAAPPGP